jgi:hypothetical protein
MLGKPFLFLLLGVLWMNKALAQETISFDITVAGIKIGEMEAEKKVYPNIENYEIKSKVKFWFFTWVEVVFEAYTQYDKGILLEAKSHTTSNKGDFSSQILLVNQQYLVNANSYKFENTKSVKAPIYLSTSKLYFEEPIDNSLFLAENFGLLSHVRKKGAYYEVEVNGNKNRFYYENGKFVKAVMQSPIKNYVVSRK